MQCCYIVTHTTLGEINSRPICMHLPFIKVGVYPHQDVFHRYLGCSDATASGQLYQVADAAKVLDVGLAGLQSADDRVMSAFHNTRIIRVKGNQVIPWDASFSIGNRKQCHKTSQTKCKVVIKSKLLNMSTTQCSSPYLNASLSFPYRFSAFPTLHVGISRNLVATCRVASS